MNEKEKDMNKKMNSEAQLTTFEAISMIVGNSIGTGIIAVPYPGCPEQHVGCCVDGCFCLYCECDSASDYCRAFL